MKVRVQHYAKFILFNKYLHEIFFIYQTGIRKILLALSIKYLDITFGRHQFYANFISNSKNISLILKLRFSGP